MWLNKHGNSAVKETGFRALKHGSDAVKKKTVLLATGAIIYACQGSVLKFLRGPAYVSPRP